MNSNNNLSELAYKFAKEMNISNGGDGKCHVSANEKGQHVYSGPMSVEDFDKMFSDSNSVLRLG